MLSDSNKAELKSSNSGHKVTISADHGDVEAQRYDGTASEPSPSHSEKKEATKNFKEEFLIEYEGPDDPLDPQDIAE
jgi:hypothetical protein